MILINGKENGAAKCSIALSVLIIRVKLFLSVRISRLISIAYLNHNVLLLLKFMQLEEVTLSAANVYGPNDKAQRKDFFNGIQRCFDDNTTGGKIVCGDLNCVLDNDLDIVSGDPHSVIKDVDLFKTMTVEKELNDVWRLSHEGEREFT